MTNCCVKATLLDEIRHIYELELAQLELQSLGADFQITNELVDFIFFTETENLDKLVKRISSFKTIGGKYTDYFYITRKNVEDKSRVYYENNYLVHSIYVYKGKFHPRLPRILINVIGLKEDDTLLDPFVGSGTTSLEAQLLGVNCIGIDISPVCVLQSKVKTESLEVLDEIIAHKEDILNKFTFRLFKSNNKFLEVIDELQLDERIKNFYKLVYLASVSDNVKRKRNLEKSFYRRVELTIKAFEGFRDIVRELNLKLGKAVTSIGDARNLFLKDETVDGIITSPPYSMALDYIENDMHAFNAMEVDLVEIKKNLIGLVGSNKERVDLYKQDMEKSYKEMYRVLKPSKFAVIVIGNNKYNSEEVRNIEFSIECCQKIGFKFVRDIKKVIHGTSNKMHSESVLFFQKV